MAHIVIVGAGITGLALAFRLRQARPDFAVTLLESEPRPGGKIWTERRDGFQVEIGPNGFLDSKPATRQLCRDLGLDGELIAASELSRKNRFLFLDDRLQKLPGGPFGLLTSRLLSTRGKLAMLREPFRGRSTAAGDESVAAFFRRRLGNEAAAVLGDVLVTGIHGGDPELLSMKAAFPRVAEIEAKYGSVIRGFRRAAKERRREAVAKGEVPSTGRMWSFRGGLRRLVEALRDRVQPICGVSVRRIESPGRAAVREDAGGAAPLETHVLTDGGSPNWIVRGDGYDSWPADAVVLACPAHRQAEILADLDAPLAEEIAAIACNRIAVVAIGFRESDVPKLPDGFGYIAPQSTRRDLLGVQWCSAIYPDRAPAGFVLWRALCGGWHRGEIVDWDDDGLLNAVRSELQLAQGVQAAPAFHYIARWPRAIPQYQIGHSERVERIEQLAARHRGLYLSGNSYHGVALNDCTEQATILAEHLAGTFASVGAGG
ncbi:MAG: protoporphyrinogen oxidase [Gemmataceae bacterium]